MRHINTDNFDCKQNKEKLFYTFFYINMHTVLTYVHKHLIYFSEMTTKQYETDAWFYLMSQK